MKHNNNSKLVSGCSLIRAFTSASKFEEFRTQNLDNIIQWLKSQTIEYCVNDEDCCVNLYMFFKSRGEFKLYENKLKELVNYVPKR